MHKNPRGRITCVLLVVLAVSIATPLSAAEKAKIRLPDGLYMYKSLTELDKDGRMVVGFGRYFIVHNNTIYNSQQALRKFGLAKLNKLFTEKKKFKVLFGGEKIGERHGVEIVTGDRMAESYIKSSGPPFIKNIKEGPTYSKDLGLVENSVARAFVVPETYKASRTVTFNAVSKDEVEKVEKLVKDKLFDLVKNRKELKQFKVKYEELSEERIKILDKITDHSGEMYMGSYGYVFRTAEGVVYEFEIVFSTRKDNVYVITSNYYYDNKTMLNGDNEICGMLDIDGCGEEELIIEKTSGGLYEYITNLEIYKQKADGNWTQVIKRIKRRDL